MALSIEDMLEVQQLKQKQEQLTVAPEQGDLTQLQVAAEWGCCTAYAFCHSLQGYEAIKTVQMDLWAQIDQDSREYPHLGFPLRGRFKMCNKLLCFIAVIRSSALQPLA